MTNLQLFHLQKSMQVFIHDPKASQIEVYLAETVINLLKVIEVSAPENNLLTNNMVVRRHETDKVLMLASKIAADLFQREIGDH